MIRRSDERTIAGKEPGAGLNAKRMHFLRTLFWVVLAVFLAIIGRNNWSDVTLNLWGTLQADIKIPLLILASFLLGFLPTWFILRGRVWQLKRRLAALSRPATSMAATPPAVPGGPGERPEAL